LGVAGGHTELYPIPKGRRRGKDDLRASDSRAVARDWALNPVMSDE